MNGHAKAAPCSIWLMPREDDARRFRSLINTLSSRFGAPTFAPHLTLLGNLPVPATDAAPAVAQCQLSSPLWLDTAGVDHSDERFESLFVRLQWSEELATLCRDVAFCLGVEQSRQYHPHVSLLYPVAPLETNVRRALCADMTRVVPKACGFDRLCVIHPTGARGWDDVESWRMV